MNTKAVLLALLLAGAAAASDALVLTSPGGQVRFRILLEQDRLSYDVTLSGKPVLDPSPLGIVVDGVNLAEGVRAGGTERYQTNQTYPMYGVHSIAVDRSNGARLALTHVKSGAAFSIEARAYDNGVAFRYVVPGGAPSGPGKPRVPDEATVFRIPAGSTVWYHDLQGHYEGEHKKRSLEQVEGGDWAAPPLTFRLPGDSGYGSITEGALVRYAGMALEADASHAFHARLGHAHPISYPYALRFDTADYERISKPAAFEGTITTPWRIVMAGADLNALVNCDIVGNVAAPPDPKYFPQGLHTSWVKPGRAVWRYLDGGEQTLDGLKEFSRMAGELGFEYHVVEGVWRRWSPEELKGFCDYSRERGVGVILWAFRRDLDAPEARRQFFDNLSKAGAAGAKIDFFDHEAREVVDLYEDLLREAAARRLVLVFHGANKPTGLARTWPNEVAREAIRGMESRNVPRARHGTTLLFTRLLAGPGDYTPMHFGDRKNDTTIAHQIASAAMFAQPLLTYAAHPRNILNSPAVDVIKTIPSVWDETIVLPVSGIGEIAAFARRRGDTWFLAIMNGPDAKPVDIPLTFLGTGSYQAVEVRDAGDTVDLETSAAARSRTVHVDLRPGGGYLARFSK